MDLNELKTRRISLISMMPNNSIAILSSANKNYRTRDVENPYRQNSDFLYLTGISEPNLICVIFKEENIPNIILFRNNTSAHEKVWEGERSDNKQLKELYGFTEVHNYDDYENRILSFLSGKDSLFIESGVNGELDDFIKKQTKNFSQNNRRNYSFPKNIIALHSITQKLRLIKSEYEIKMIKEAAKVSIKAHKLAMKKSKPGMYEYELDAEIKYIFNKNNMQMAYMSIVGGGKNACTLHYVKNNCKLKDDDLVLIDAAAENQGYASDITRTFPVNGKFNEEQSLIYDVVLKAQEKAIKFIKPGVTWDEVHKETVNEISRGLIELNLIKDSFENVIKKELYKDFFMHKTGHWLGLDVHDVGEYENVCFQPGMVITVEPGIYIDSANKNVSEKWRGIGVRIEDDVLITNKGNEVITLDLAKKRNEVESLCNK
jgi:Xaa-Pro aminopeptidase